MEITSHICKVGLVFTNRKVKDGCPYYSSSSSQKRISTPTITVLTEFFPLLIKGNKVLPLLPPLHIFLAQLMRLQTAHPTDTQQILPPQSSLLFFPLFSTDLHLVPCRLVQSFICFFFAFGYDTKCSIINCRHVGREAREAPHMAEE